MILFSFVLFAGSCEKIEDCPDCINKKVKEFSKSGICKNGTADVAEYIFQDQLVYVFSDGTCGADMGASVYSSECERMGFLGGISGNLIINGVKFYETAVYQKMIWHD